MNTKMNVSEKTLELLAVLGFGLIVLACGLTVVGWILGLVPGGWQ